MQQPSIRWGRLLLTALLFACVPALVLAADSTVAQNAASAITTTSLFNIPKTDYSMQLLGQFFGTVAPVLTGSNKMAGTLFRVFNSAVLALGGIMVMYALFTSVLNTAWDGTMMGQKHNKSAHWIVLRIVFGMGLLIPQASGYSLIQVLLMWIVVQGVGAADTMWKTAIDYFDDGGTVFTQGRPEVQYSQYVLKDAKHTGASGVMQGMICAYKLEKLVQENPGVNKPSKNIYSSPVRNFSPYGVANGLNYNGNVKTANQTATMQFPASFLYNGTDLGGKCGSLSWTLAKGQANNSWFNPFFKNRAANNISVDGANSQSQGEIGSTQGAAVQQMVIDVEQNAKQVAHHGLPQTEIQDVQMQNALMKAATDYGNTIQPLVSGFTRPKIDLSVAAKEGWILAGSWYYSISTLTSGPNSNTYNVNTAPPALSSLNSLFSPTLLQSITTTINSSIISKNISTAKSTMDAAVKQNASFYAAQHAVPIGVNTQLGGLAWDIMKVVFMGLTNVCNDWNMIFADPESPWSSNIISPVVKIANLGNLMVEQVQSSWVNGAMWLLGIGALAGAFPCSAVALSSVLTWLVPIIFLVMVTLLSVGIIYAFYVPLVPYMLFTFGALGWLIGVLEAMVAAPIVALGLAHPEGQHDAFGKAEPAVYLMINLFLRPTLMIIGLLFGMTLAYVALNLMNVGIGRAFAGVMQFAGIQGGVIGGFFKPIGVMIIYTIITVIIINKTFSLINIIPDKVLRWIEGGAAYASAFGDDSAGMEQQASQGFKGASGEVSRGAGEAIKGTSRQASKMGQTAGSALQGDEETPEQAPSSGGLEGGDPSADSSDRGDDSSAEGE
ncbi:MAG: DotA protein [marine bacterium B5-7]|nr:MAG: DotA protein [marine bacterium B5-7]